MMTLIQSYLVQYKDAPAWELRNIKKALSALGGFLNSEDDNARLQAVSIILRSRKG